jgi:hypothetical protein
MLGGVDVNVGTVFFYIFSLLPLDFDHQSVRQLSFDVLPLGYSYFISGNFSSPCWALLIPHWLPPKMTGKFSEKDPERCVHYAGFMSHISLAQSNGIFWVLFMIVLLLMCLSSLQHHK